jgi:hypothetical protein
MFLRGLVVMPTGPLEPAESISGPFAKAEKMSVQAIPESEAAAGREISREFQRQWPMPGAGHILAQLLLVRREDADAAPPA